MTFISGTYALFLLLALVIFWSVQQPSRRLWVLLIASLVFYASLQIQYIPLLLGITLINFSLGKAIGTNTAPGPHATNQRLSNEDWMLAHKVWNRRRLTLLWLGIFLNVIGLLSFKYVPFVLTNLAAPLNLPNAKESASWISTHLVAPDRKSG